jgi:hypothetical protein
MRTRVEIEHVIDTLAYDFRAFTPFDFVEHVQTVLQQSIYVLSVPLGPGFFGFWVRKPKAHYIIHNTDLHPTHKIHTLLHELAHIVLQHQGKPLSEVVSPEIAAQLGIGGGTGLQRVATLDWRDDPQEIECETFAYLIQQKLAQVERLEAITAGTSIEPLQRYVDAMGYTD